MAAKTVTKQEIVAQVTAQASLPQPRVAEIIQKTFDCMAELLAQGRRIEVRNFGVFDVRVKRARMGRILATMQPVEIPTRAVVRFKPGKEMRKAVAERATTVLTVSPAVSPSTKAKPDNKTAGVRKAI